MAKTKKNSPIKVLKQNLLPVVLFVVLTILILFTYQIFMADKYYPVTKVGETNISFLTKGQAIKAAQSNFQKRTRQKLTFSYAQGSVTLDLATSSAVLDYSALNDNFTQTHNSSFTFFSTANITPQVSLDLDKQLNAIAKAVDKNPQNAKLVFDETPGPEGTPSSRIQITEDENGFTLDKDEVKKAVTDYLLTGKYTALLPLKTVSPKVTTRDVVKAKETLEKLQTQPIQLVFENLNWTLDTKQLLALLDLETGQGTLLDKDRTYLYLQKIASEIDQPVQEGLFDFNPATKRVAAFKPSQEGRKMDTDKTWQLLSDALNESLNNITLPVDIIKPKIATSDVNSLGIKELLGRGISNFTGSIPNRIYNINLTAVKINGVLIPPGQVFSFNQTVGDISAATGFKQAYVIKEGRTVLDDGGGVCQDSTTLFRAVLNAGLPVVKRTAHAYRVGYYEQGYPPGLDATVFYPSVDFQFKNDTGAYILIQAYTSGTTLYIDLYGSPDGRITTLTKPVISSQTPPPPELRQDDPALPKGTVKQVDWAAWGANVSFKRTVIRGGETLLDETWRSNYKPWQAVYLVGTKD